MAENDNIFNNYDKNLYKLGYVPDDSGSVSNVNTAPASNELAGSATGGAINPNPQDPSSFNSGSNPSTIQQPVGNLQSGKTKFDNTESGYILGVDKGVGKLYIGNTTNYLNWDGTTLTVSGSITATTGAIGGFTIGFDYIRDSANSFGLSSTVSVGDDVRFWAGDTFANRASAPFRVTESGVLTAISGTIGGFTMAATTLSATSVILDSGNQKITVGTGANMITLDGSAGTISAAGSSWILNGSGVMTGFGFIAQDIGIATGVGTNARNNFNICSNTTGSVIFISYIENAANLAYIYRLAKDTLTNNYYITHSTTLTVTSGGATLGMAVVGSYLFVSAIIGGGAGSNSLRRYDIADLANVTTFTFSGTSRSGGCFSDGTDLYVVKTTSEASKFTLSGTTATNAGDITYTSAGVFSSYNPACDGTSVWFRDADTGAQTLRKYPLAGGAATSTKALVINLDAFYKNALDDQKLQLFMGNSVSLGMGWNYSSTSATAVTGILAHLMFITKP